MKREHNKSIKEFAAQLEKLHKDLSKARDAALSQLADESLKNEPGRNRKAALHVLASNRS